MTDFSNSANASTENSGAESGVRLAPAADVEADLPAPAPTASPSGSPPGFAASQRVSAPVAEPALATSPPASAATGRQHTESPVHATTLPGSSTATETAPGSPASTSSPTAPTAGSSATTSGSATSLEDLSSSLDAQAPSESLVQSSPSLRPQTRLQSGIRKEKVYTDGTVKYGLLTSSGEPYNLEEALHDKNWKLAMDSEYTAL